MTVQEAVFTDIEMPGQYLCGEEVTPDTSVFLERIHSNVAIVRRHGTSYRRLGFQGSDGHIRYFIVQTGQHFSNNPGGGPKPSCSLRRHRMDRWIGGCPGRPCAQNPCALLQCVEVPGSTFCRCWIRSGPA